VLTSESVSLPRRTPIFDLTSLVWLSAGANKRRRHVSEVPVQVVQSEQQTVQSEEQTIQSEEQTVHSEEQTVQSEEQTAHSEEQTVHSEQQTLQPTTQDFLTNPVLNRNYPEATRLPYVFPINLINAIRQNEDGTAIITTRYPPDPTQCQLRLDIEPGEVQDLARRLFDVYIKVDGGQVRLVLDSGATFRIRQYDLQGAQHAAIEKVFGNVVSTAYQRSTEKAKEWFAGITVTNCVFMDFSDGAFILGIILDSDSLYPIVQTLWPN
jgi:hypothetical protein